MQKVDPTVCSAAFTIVCTASGHSARGTVAERSDNADNYRAEALGAMCGLLVHRAASQRAYRYKECEAFCDNLGVVKHASRPTTSLPEKQVQADVLCLIKHLIRELPFSVNYQHVYGHLDAVLNLSDLTPVQRLNVDMDAAAKSALIEAIATREFISSDFPFEQVTLSCSGIKATGSPTKAIYRWWGSRTARELFHSKKIVNRDLFDLIHWRGMDKLMGKYPKIYRNFVTKHVSGCSGINSHLAHWDDTVQNFCPSCGNANESVFHITTCRNEGRIQVFKESVDELVAWMRKNQTDPLLATLIQNYLRAHGGSSMFSVAPDFLPPLYRLLVKHHDRLGWRNFTEGRFLSLYVEIQRRHLRKISSFRSADSWATGLMDQLLRICHRQWLMRNEKVHFKRGDGRTLAQHEATSLRIRDLMWTDPDDLLEGDRGLLDEDFEALGSAHAADRECWVASMDAAVAAAGHAKRKAQQDADEEAHEGVASAPIPIDSEGSIRYRRRRKRV